MEYETLQKKRFQCQNHLRILNTSVIASVMTCTNVFVDVCVCVCVYKYI